MTAPPRMHRRGDDDIDITCHGQHFADCGASAVAHLNGIDRKPAASRPSRSTPEWPAMIQTFGTAAQNHRVAGLRQARRHRGDIGGIRKSRDHTRGVRTRAILRPLGASFGKGFADGIRRGGDVSSPVPCGNTAVGQFEASRSPPDNLFARLGSCREMAVLSRRHGADRGCAAISARFFVSVCATDRTRAAIWPRRPMSSMSAVVADLDSGSLPSMNAFPGLLYTARSSR